MSLPYQGGTPTLIPNMFGSSMSLSGTLDAKSPAQFAVDNPRVTAKASATIGGSVTNSDTVSLTVTHPQLPAGAITVTFTVLTSDTVQDIAEGLATLFNAAVQAAGGAALVTAIWATTGTTTIASEATVYINWSGPLGNLAVVTSSVTGSATETVQLAQGTTLVTSATATALIGSGTTPTAADVDTLTFTNPGVTGFPRSVAYTVAGSDTPTLIASGLVALILADTVLQAAQVTASNSAGPTTVTVSQKGVIGNTTVLSYTVSAGGTETVVLTPANGHLAGGAGVPNGKLVGGSGPVFAAQNFNYSYGGTVQSFYYGKPYLLDGNFLAALAAADMPVV